VTEDQASQPERHLPEEDVALETQESSVADDCLKCAPLIEKHSDEFAKSHSYWARAGSLGLKSAGYLSLSGMVKAGTKLGGKKIVRGALSPFV
jgi:hypothetical protein